MSAGLNCGIKKVTGYNESEIEFGKKGTLDHGVIRCAGTAGTGGGGAKRGEKIRINDKFMITVHMT